jgi:hypothetical protein
MEGHSVRHGPKRSKNSRSAQDAWGPKWLVDTVESDEARIDRPSYTVFPVTPIQFFGLFNF